MTQVAEQNVFLSNLQRLQVAPSRNGRAWLDTLRKEAFERFEAVGLPTTRDEEWRFTNVAPIGRTAFALAEYESGPQVAEAVANATFGRMEAYRLVFVNGHYSPDLSQGGSLPVGGRAQSLAYAIDHDGALVKEHLARYATEENSPFVTLNTAFIRDGAFIHLPKGTVLDRPIHLVMVSTGGAEPRVSHPRVLIVAEDSVQATIVESYVAAGPGAYFTNPVTEVVSGANCHIEHVKMQQESLEAFHVGAMQFNLGAATTLLSHNISLGGGLVRTDLHAVLGGEGTEAILNGLYILGGRQHVDNHMLVEHVAAHCGSHELYKGVLDGRSSAAFKGKIFVRPGAQKTDAKQTNKNLLLSDDAVVDTMPQLQIYADDVKCTHGATIGQLDEEQMFYLRTRGIPEDAARNLLTFAFAADVVERIRNRAVRTELEEMLYSRHHLMRELPAEEE